MTTGRLFLDATLQSFEYHKGLADRAMAQVANDDLHAPLAPTGNSIAVLAKHVGGNLTSRWTDFLTTDGEKPWRHRDREFADDLHDREDLDQQWNSGWTILFETLRGLTPADLERTVTIRGEDHSVPMAIQRSLAHTAYHVGQIVELARFHAGDAWQTLSIPRDGSDTYNRQKGHGTS